MRQKKLLILEVCFLSLLGLLLAALPAYGQGGSPLVQVISEVHHDVSPPLRDIAPIPPGKERHVHPVRPIHEPNPNAQLQEDPVVQTAVGSFVVTTNIHNFEGVGDGAYGFTPNSAPPDTNGAVGATQFVQWVNESFAVFDKATGNLLHGPVTGNTLWSGFGGGCQTNNDGDVIAQYDKAAGRWVLTQFSVRTTPFLQCVAVSTTSDATGTYHRYAFPMGPNFPDYPKLGVWPDAYYMSFNMFGSNFFAGARACALNRSAMLSGAAATAICFQLSPSFGGLLPSDLDGSIAPPLGSPNFFLNFGANSLNLWKFHVDFTHPGNSTLTGPTKIPVAPFNEACGGGTCVLQSQTTQMLDSLGDRLMYRLAYRHFADGHESLVVNHSVQLGASTKNPFTGVRWYEIRSPGTSPTVHQQSTFSPDSTFRWMGSVAMDKLGDMAVGYSASSGSIHPAIRFTGRLATDALNTLAAESTIINGTGSQKHNLNRWGDYSSMAIDPVDDCTFWYTTEYLAVNGTFNWHTRIASFKFPSCK